MPLSSVVTNHPVHDPDIQHLPWFAISNQFLNNLYSSYYKRIMLIDKLASFAVQFQHKLYFVVMCLARFNLYSNSYAFLAKRAFAGKRDRGGKWTFWLEVVCLLLFWNWYIAVLKGTGSWKNALAYLLITNMVPSPLHVQVLSHFS
jgi:delta8-fatty-acid desaturase